VASKKIRRLIINVFNKHRAHTVSARTIQRELRRQVIKKRDVQKKIQKFRCAQKKTWFLEFITDTGKRNRIVQCFWTKEWSSPINGMLWLTRILAWYFGEKLESVTPTNCICPPLQKHLPFNDLWMCDFRWCGIPHCYKHKQKIMSRDSFRHENWLLSIVAGHFFFWQRIHTPRRQYVQFISPRSSRYAVAKHNSQFKDSFASRVVGLHYQYFFPDTKTAIAETGVTYI
jgi:hypothetical protein